MMIYRQSREATKSTIPSLINRGRRDEKGVRTLAIRREQEIINTPCGPIITNLCTRIP